MSTIVTRAGKGSSLSWTEMDANLTNLNTDKLESGSALGTPASGTLTNCTGLPVSTGVSGLGTGVATALGVNTGSAGAPVLFNGALGTPSSGNLANCTGYPSSIPTGATFDYVGSSAPSGYVLLSGKTIGNGSSGGTERANADTSDLFTLLWNSMADTEAAVSGGRGASAAADFAANKTITLPDARGRVIAGKDNMGGSTASRITNAGAGIVGTTLGISGGSQTHTLTIAQLAAHNHTIDGYAQSISYGLIAGGSTTLYSPSVATSTTGSGDAHNNTQPTLVLNKIIKL